MGVLLAAPAAPCLRSAEGGEEEAGRRGGKAPRPAISLDEGMVRPTRGVSDG